MSAANVWNRKVAVFLFGVLSTLAVFFLTGAGGVTPVGKYQMEIVMRDRTTQIYVMDTSTGVVKWVKDMNTPFSEMKGD